MKKLSTRKVIFGEDPSNKVNSSEFRRSLAIVIGIDNYSNGIPSLATAVNDARELAKILGNEHKYEVILLTDEEATLPRLKEVFTKDFPEKLAKNDRLLVYFAGHGVALDCDKGPEGYLIPQDATLKEDSFWPMTKLHEALDALPCRHLLAILDCCFAGAFRWSSKRDFQPLPPVIYKERYERFIRSSAWQVITSAAHDQKALDVLSGNVVGEHGVVQQETQPHSPFALSLFEALRGAADLQNNGVVTATELYLYLRDQVEVSAEKLADHQQTPGLWPLNKHRHGEFIFLVPNRDIDLPPAPDLTEKNNPYKGLSSYEKGDSKLFFGRTALIKKLWQTVEEHPLTVVLGASGTGKSSLVKAGLLPALEKGTKIETEDGDVSQVSSWFILEKEVEKDEEKKKEVMRPGANPLAVLRSLLIKELPGVRPEREKGFTPAGLIGQWSKKNPGKKLLLIIDQFEELITLCREEQARESFIRELMQALEEHSEVLRIVLTLRSDFESQIVQIDLWENYWHDKSRFIVPAMTQDELREVVEQPASVKVLYFEPHEVIDSLINEVIQTPGALPLLSFTLSELYLRYVERQKDVERQDGNRALTEADYKEIGGVIGSLRRRINQEYEQLDAAHQATMKRIMLRMIAFEGGELTRRRVPDWELDYPDAAENERVEKVIDILFQARLIVTGSSENAGGKTESYIEPAHDALIVAWEKLLKWRIEEEEAMLLQRQLTRAAADWEGSAGEKEKKGLLWDNNPRLARAQEILQEKRAGRRLAEKKQGQFLWLKQFCRVLFPSFEDIEQSVWLNRVETDFVRRSVERKRNWTWRVTLSIIAIVLSLSAIALFAWQQKEIADDRRIEADREKENAIQQERKAVSSLEKANYNLAKVFEGKALTAWEEAQKDHSNESYMQAILFASSALYQKNSKNQSALEITTIRTIFKNIVFDTALAERYALLSQWPLSSAVFRADGKRIISTSFNNTIQLWDTASGEELNILKGHESAVRSAVFSPDGKRIASASDDKTVRIWNSESGEGLNILKGHESAVHSVVFSPDGKRIAFALKDKTVQIWNSESGKELALKGHEEEIFSAAFSPDGERIASASDDKTVRIWNSESGKELSVFKGHKGTVYSVVFSPDGKQVASASWDKTVRIWDSENDTKDKGVAFSRLPPLLQTVRSPTSNFIGGFEINYPKSILLPFVEAVKFLWQLDVKGMKIVHKERTPADMERFGSLLAPPPPNQRKFDQVLEWARQQRKEKAEP